MTGRQLRSTLKKLGLSQLEAARQLGIAPRTMRYWIAGERRIPETAAMVLRMWITSGPPKGR